MRKFTSAIAATLLAATVAQSPAHAWFHGFSGGGWSRGGDLGAWSYSTAATAGAFSHSSDWGGWDHSTQVTSSGVAHESDYGGAWHGTAADSQGAYHASDYGGYYHSTSVNSTGATHTGYYGTTTTAYGNYYHQPTTANYYGNGCYNCAATGWGAAAAGAAVGAAAGAAVGAAATAAAYTPPPSYYTTLPAGCFYQGAYREYQCGSTWLSPAYGANGVYYQVVPAP